MQKRMSESCECVAFCDDELCVTSSGKSCIQMGKALKCENLHILQIERRFDGASVAISGHLHKVSGYEIYCHKYIFEK